MAALLFAHLFFGLRCDHVYARAPSPSGVASEADGHLYIAATCKVTPAPTASAGWVVLVLGSTLFLVP